MEWWLDWVAGTSRKFLNCSKRHPHLRSLQVTLPSTLLRSLPDDCVPSSFSSVPSSGSTLPVWG